DVLVLGREANARYASGARRLWTAGTRPFGPGCVVVRATRQVHLLSVWDEGIPESIPRENLYGLSWNPMNLIGAIGRIPGAAEAARVGVDGMSPLMAQLLPTAFPKARIEAAEDAMLAARRVKTADEVGCIRAATAVAEAALDAAMAALRPGARERELLAAFLARLGDFGVQVPASEGTFCATPKARSEPRAPSPVGVARGSGPGARDAAPPLRQLASGRAVGEGEVVAVAGGGLYAG